MNLDRIESLARDETFSGVVRRLNIEMLVLRTRSEPEQIVLLRDDTRFLASGLPSDFRIMRMISSSASNTFSKPSRR